jgi:hypothetical protein
MKEIEKRIIKSWYDTKYTVHCNYCNKVLNKAMPLWKLIGLGYLDITHPGLFYCNKYHELLYKLKVAK